MTNKNKYSVDQLVALFKAQQWDKIIKNADGFKRANPNHLDVMTILGVSHAQTGHLLKAKGFLKKPSNWRPNCPQPGTIWPMPNGIWVSLKRRNILMKKP